MTRNTFSAAALFGLLALAAAEPEVQGKFLRPGAGKPSKLLEKFEKIKSKFPKPGKPGQGPEPVDSEALQAAIGLAGLEEKGKELNEIAYSTPDNNRVMGSEGYDKTLDWITGYLDQWSDYYTYEIQPFEALFSNSDANLTIDGEAVEDAGSFEYSPGGEVEASLVIVDNLGCDAADFPEDVEGKIALISRGDCPFGQKAALAGNAGAAAAIIYNNVGGSLSATLGASNPAGEYVPTVGISQAFAETLLASIEGGATVNGLVETISDIRNITTFNVIAETIGGDHDTAVVLGAHADSVFAGPGINDDGSGTIGLLETAQQLTKYSTKNAVRFCWWGAEEFGLLGSTYYVENLSQQELAKVRLYLNFDMIASPNYIFSAFDGDGSAFNLTGPPGSAEIEAFFEGWYEDNEIPLLPAAFTGRTDYQAFANNGVACGGLFTGAEVEKTEEQAELFGGTAGESYDPNYHLAGDNYDNLNFAAFLTNTKAMAAALAEYATSVSTLPPGDNTISKRQASPLSPPPMIERQTEGCGFHKHV